MFTGIVEEIGIIRKIQKKGNSAVLQIACSKVLEGTREGDSIAVNGICLTVTQIDTYSFGADVMTETMRRSSLTEVGAGDKVNLERAMAADGRFGGHIVSGHIDGTGRIAAIQREENAVWYTIETKPELLWYIVEKGSITIDGISLTVAEVKESSFQVSVIPHTRQITTLSEKRVGDTVNLECDMIGKYIERFVSGKCRAKTESITEEFLSKYGFYQ